MYLRKPLLQEEEYMTESRDQILSQDLYDDKPEEDTQEEDIHEEDTYIRKQKLSQNICKKEDKTSGSMYTRGSKPFSQCEYHKENKRAKGLCTMSLYQEEMYNEEYELIRCQSRINKKTGSPVFAQGYINDYLENDLCTKIASNGNKEVVYGERAEEDLITMIMLHYTVCRDIKTTKRAFYGGGVSAHYTIDRYGRLYLHVHPNMKAFHAGKSAFCKYENLNRISVGIELTNLGFVRFDETYLKGYGNPIKLYGSNNLWFPFDDEQFVTSVLLTTGLQKQHRIPGRFVISHSDAAIGRKFDVGPRYDYHRAFFEYGAGYYYEKKDINLDLFKKLEYSDYIELLKFYGYRPLLEGNQDSNTLRAFQMHFSPSDISGELSDVTKASILNLVIDYEGYKDVYNGVDNIFSEKLKNFITNNEDRTSGFSEFISI